MMSKLTIRSEPLGTVLIIGSWNFPLSLTLQPLISAIAAGCTAIVKPSEVSVHTCRLLKELLPLYLDKVAFPVIYADGGQTAQLLKHHPFDLVFYTGSSRVGTGSFFHSLVHIMPQYLRCHREKNDQNYFNRKVLSSKIKN